MWHQFEPCVGQVIKDRDSRGGTPKRIVALDGEYVYCRAGRKGVGRRTRISRKRLSDYMVIEDAPPSA